MFKKPDTNKFITVTIDWTDFFKHFSKLTQLLSSIDKMTGKVVPSESYDDPNTFRLLTNNTNYPISIIPLSRVTILEYTDGTSPEVRTETEQPDEESWEVVGSKGDIYIVTRRGDTWFCPCKGFGFRANCTHVIEKKQLVLDRSK